MQVLKNAVGSGQMICRLGGQYRNYMATKPRVRVPLAEKLAHGAVMFCGMLAVPTWIALHLKDYREKK